MKKISSLILVTGMLLAACNNNKAKSKSAITSEDGKGQATIFDPKKMQQAAADMEKQKTELEKLIPLTIDQLKAMIPETLMGAKRTNFEANTSMGAGLASGEYDLTDSTNIKLSIYDCAGAGGAGIYSMQYLGMLNSEDENTRTIDFNGGKAFEQCDKSSDQCTITYFTGGRFLVTLEGDHVSAAALKDAAKGMNIK